MVVNPPPRCLPAAGLCLAGWLGLCSTLHAAPYTPANDDQVLLELSNPGPASRPAPTDRQQALQQAREQMDYAMAQEDLRFLGYAQASLTGHLDDPQAGLLMARIEQYRHQFDAARSRLTRLLSRHPELDQGWLLLANLERLRGDFTAARRACQSASTLPPVSRLLCQASVQTMGKQQGTAYRTLQQLLAGSSALQPQGQQRQWLLTLLAEMAWQRGRPQQGLEYVQLALQAAPQEPYLRYLQSDLWLALGNHQAVIDNLTAWQQREGALLRLAIAGKRIQHPQARLWRDRYQQRLDEAQRYHRSLHLREQTRYLLTVSEDYPAALHSARQNWQQQKEIVDLRLLAEAALRQADRPSTELVAAFVRQHGIDDVPLNTLRDADR